jgi:hypothetical protein
MRARLGLRSAQILALSGVCCWSAALHAQPADTPVRFEYVAEVSCPDGASFAERVRRRTTQGREADPGELARTFYVNVSRSAGGFLGVIEFLDDGGTTVMRRVSGEQCSAVVDSLALIAALALDASLREEAPPEPAEPKPTPSAPPPPLPLPLPPPDEIAEPPEQNAQLPSTRVGVAAGYDTAISAPTLSRLGQVDLGRRFSLRLSTHVAWHDKGTTDERAARLRLLALETSACFALLREGQFASSTCVWVDVGSLRAAGKESPALAAASSATIFWASAGPEIRLAWEPPVPFWADLRTQLGFPMISHEFRFQAPDELVYRVPRVSAGAMISTGLRF